jgi:hypothetical protein
MEDAICETKKKLACIVQINALTDTEKELAPERLLELLHMLAHGGL